MPLSLISNEFHGNIFLHSRCNLTWRIFFAVYVGCQSQFANALVFGTEAFSRKRIGGLFLVLGFVSMNPLIHSLFFLSFFYFLFSNFFRVLHSFLIS